MRQLRSWVVGACVGFGRACVVLLVSMLVPAVWAAAVGLWLWWGGNPWSWIAPFVWAIIGTLALARPVCRMFRSLVAKWTGHTIPAGYREPGPIVRMANGYWWNGYSYERTSRDAHRDQRLRTWWHDPATWRDLRFVALAPVTVGVVAAIPPAGVVAAVLGFSQPTLAARLVGVLGVVVAIRSAPHAWRPVAPVAARFLGASAAVALADRVDELTTQRADLTVAQAAEIRRIERDLHDGAQARLVALGLSLATAEKLMDTNPEQAKALLRDARVGAATSLTELRELVRGINPPVLTERGLVDAVRVLALDSPLETEVSADLQVRLDPPIESAVYFGVSELLANAVKHARATHARISITQDDTGLVVVVEDNGRGGAEVRPGGGLAGLRRRLAVFDGTCEVTSPAGGPTRARMVVPCASL
ncbi:sensor histidine kinase [Goodfellowiella coeruleoviolacea]|uniref:histidine kinase n=1 Tax=Goodfellowiella coeruleoviolacea TaxID=334858 RepID=A0AAE3GJX9_9PSEU|nr:sensor histidine kinase [Goodfellowiella coeruleoviolacea]MCP2168825.1 Signal transduction histidine kinase [Goodfellowiella coeruleoviolacea]